MTTTEYVSLFLNSGQISATVHLDSGEAFDLDDVVLSTPETHEIKLKIGDLTTGTIQELYEVAEKQYKAFMEAE